MGSMGMMGPMDTKFLNTWESAVSDGVITPKEVKSLSDAAKSDQNKTVGNCTSPEAKLDHAALAAQLANAGTSTLTVTVDGVKTKLDPVATKDGVEFHVRLRPRDVTSQNAGAFLKQVQAEVAGGLQTISRAKQQDPSRDSSDAEQAIFAGAKAKLQKAVDLNKPETEIPLVFPSGMSRIRIAEMQRDAGERKSAFDPLKTEIANYHHRQNQISKACRD